MKKIFRKNLFSSTHLYAVISLFFVFLFYGCAYSGSQASKANQYNESGIYYKKNGDYEKALEYYKRALIVYKKEKGEIHPYTALVYDNIGAVYQDMGREHKAIVYYKKALTIRESVFGNKHRDTARSYNKIALVYQNMGEYSKALQYYKKALSSREAVLGKEDLDTATSYNNIGALYKEMGKYDKALLYLRKALRIRKKELGDTSIATAISYNNLGSLYQEMGKYPKALQYLKRALSIDRRVLGEENTNIATSYNNIGTLYKKMQKYPEALNYFHKALKASEKATGMRSDNTAETYNNLGVVYQAMGEYEKASLYYGKALGIKEALWGKKSIKTVSIYNNLGLFYAETGKYDKALKQLKKTIKIEKRVLGKENIVLTKGYNNLATVYQDMGEYPEALQYYQKALKISKRVLGEEHIDIATGYNNISSLYQDMADYDIALKYLEKALKIKKKIFGSNNIDIAVLYNNIGALYKERKESAKAMVYLKKALAIYKTSLKKDHPYIAGNYNNLAIVYQDIGKYTEAIAYFKKALAMNRKVFGEGNIYMAENYNNLGVLYQDTKVYDEAVKYLKKALEIKEKVLGEKNPGTIRTYNNLASVYFESKEYSMAYHYAELAQKAFLHNRDSVFTVLNEKQKKQYLKRTSNYIYLLLQSAYLMIEQLEKVHADDEVQKIQKSTMDAWLNYKGSLFDTENTIVALYNTTKNYELKRKIKETIVLKRVLARLYQSLPKPKERPLWQEKIKRTEKRLATLNQVISAKAYRFKVQQGLNTVSYKEVSSHLKKNELYIDYAKIGKQYCRFTLDMNNSISFLCYDMNKSQRLEGLIGKYRENIDTLVNEHGLTDEKLLLLTDESKKILSKLDGLLIDKRMKEVLGHSTDLIISSDGALRLFPFEVLYDEAKGKYLIEKKKIRYIPSGRELIRLYGYEEGKRNVKKETVIFAYPDFNVKKVSVPVKKESKKEKLLPSLSSVSRSGIVKSLFRMRFAPLPGTKEEAERIRSVLMPEKIVEYSDENATENNLLKTQKPARLHIATHGFFINDSTVPNPMLRSGIALAGANTSIIQGKNNGVVTALKLSGMNLQGTELVVLSACQTGVVDVNSTDSVSGLSKAFIQAGAKDIVMSLWSVDDHATLDLMTRFYENIQKGEAYAPALKHAKQHMIDKWKHPFYWAAFIINGE
jgi:tetratricopeptide (TPR) repeat protein